MGYLNNQCLKSADCVANLSNVCAYLNKDKPRNITKSMKIQVMYEYHQSLKICNVIVDVAHYDDVIMSVMASLITSLTIVYLTVYSATDHRKHQSFASLAFVRGIHRWPVNPPHKGPVTRKMFPFDDIIMITWERSVVFHSRQKACRQTFQIRIILLILFKVAVILKITPHHGII